jgi:hypothetical protein
MAGIQLGANRRGRDEHRAPGAAALAGLVDGTREMRPHIQHPVGFGSARAVEVAATALTWPRPVAGAARGPIAGRRAGARAGAGHGT